MLVKGVELIQLSEFKFKRKLEDSLDIEYSQLKAWSETYKIFKKLVDVNNLLKEVEFLFEYKLPLTNGKRPDVLMFVRNTIYVIEFKNRENFNDTDIVQLNQYVDLITNYHSESKNYQIKPILLLNTNETINETNELIKVVSVKEFINSWAMVQNTLLKPHHPVNDFIKGYYKPSVEILTYAKNLFSNNEIKGIQHPILEETNLAFKGISELINKSKDENFHSLIIVSGVPGSGKSALALKLIKYYNAAYITKNPKFLELIKHNLKHQVNFHSSTAVIKEFIENKRSLDESVIVVDEAQRVWDERRINEYHDKDISEHSIILNHINPAKKWSSTILFIGIDQQLASSETSYFDKWITAFDKVDGNNLIKKVFCSPSIQLGESKIPIRYSNILQLNNSIRNNFDNNFPKLIDDIIENPKEGSIKSSINFFKKQGFKFFITRDINIALNNVKEESIKNKKTYCIIGTTSFQEDFYSDVFIDYNDSRNNDIKPYFEGKSLSNSFIKNNPLSHFHTLGLEFDFPIICWNRDYLFYNNCWNYDLMKRVENFGFFYVRNAYRVLMSRGREGLVLYFPDDWVFDSTYKYFVNIGFDKIEQKNKISTRDLSKI